MKATTRHIRVGICQFITGLDKAANLERARRFIHDAAKGGADIITLPEMFNTPYSKEYFRDYAEDESGQSFQMLSQAAKETGKYLIGGSIPELSEGKVYNTSFIFDRSGNLITKHRKLHMFDIDIPGQSYRESEVISGGNQITVFDTDYCKIGVGICYDIRFPEQSLIMRKKGAELLVFPASFNPTTGPLHFELLGKSRALDTQTFVVLSAPARDLTQKTGYLTWGHSAVINPNGLTVAQAELTEKVLFADLDLEDVTRQRMGFPFEAQARRDLYDVAETQK